MVRISDIQNGEVLWDTVPFCNINISDIPTYELKKKDILFARTGGTVGKSFLVNDIPYTNAIYAGYLIRTRYSSLLNPNYLKMFMDSKLYWNQLRDGTTATAQPNCNGQTLGKMLIPIPPISEQNRIIEYLNNIQPLIDKYSIKEKKLNSIQRNFPEQLKKSILQEAIQGKLVSQDPNDEPASVLLERIRAEKEELIKQGIIKKDKNESIIYRRDNSYYEKSKEIEQCIDDEIPFEIPNHWCWVRLGEIFQHNTGKALNNANQSGKLLEYITTSNLYWNRFELDKLRSMYFKPSEVDKCTVKKGDLLVCEGGDIGRSAIWKYDFEMRIQNHIHRLRPYVKMCIQYFFYLFFFYKSAGKIGGKGIGIQGLSSNSLHQTLFPIPPINEQYRIVTEIERLFKLCDKL